MLVGLAAAGQWKVAVWIGIVPIALGLLYLLFWVTFEPMLSRGSRRLGKYPVQLPEPAGAESPAPVYSFELPAAEA